MSTIKDVAKLAGVSVTAVSKVMHNSKDIGEKTKAKILQAVEELNYSPNAVAQKLSQKSSRTIGLLLANFEASDGRDCVLYQIMKGAYKAGNDTGYEIIAITGDATTQAKNNFDKFCREHKLAGVIIQGLNSKDPYFIQIKNSKFYSVGIDMNSPTKVFGCIGVDNIKASEDAVNYLISKGKRNIGIFTGANTEIVCQERLIGYKNALHKNNIEFTPNYVLDCSFSEVKAYEKAKSFFEINPEIDSIFCISDLMAIGLLRYCKENGISIPNNMAVIGFDDIPLCNYIYPKLTTIHQDMYQIGYRSVEELIRMIKTKCHGRKKIISHKIIKRESC